MTNKNIVKIIFKALLAFIEVLVELFQEEIGNGKEEEETDTQLCYFPMEYLRITQKENTGSHRKSLAMDFGGKDAGKDILYAPCDLKVIRVRDKANGEVYAESLFPILFADGTKDYLHILLLHDDNSFKLKVGDIIKQHEAFYKEGGMYDGDPSHYANHVHIEAGKGKWKNPIQFKNDVGTYVCENQEHLYNLFWLKRGTKNLNDTEHKFKYEN